MAMHNLVHCHICPVKECCSYSQTDASWRWHNQGQWRKKWHETYWADYKVEPEADDLKKVQQATLNCPLKALLQDWQWQKLREMQKLCRTQ